MARYTGNLREFARLLIPVFKMFLVNSLCHLHHPAGCFLVRIIVAREIQFLGIICILGMAKTTLHAQRYFEIVHHLLYLLLGDVFRKHF